MVEQGDVVRVVTTKWGGKPHWEYDARYLGADAHGDWVGSPPGTHMARPGAEVTTQHPFVCLVPRPGAGGGAGWMATFIAPGHTTTIYVDMTTVPRWSPDGSRVTAADLDLDIIQRADGTTFVDDEDEFAEHQAAYGYPSDVVSLAEGSAAWVLGEVVAGRAPFDGDSADRWLRPLAMLTGREARPRP